MHSGGRQYRRPVPAWDAACDKEFCRGARRANEDPLRLLNLSDGRIDDDGVATAVERDDDGRELAQHRDIVVSNYSDARCGADRHEIRVGSIATIVDNGQDSLWVHELGKKGEEEWSISIPPRTLQRHVPFTFEESMPVPPKRQGTLPIRER
jgi:hypothetical protein